MNYQRHYHSNQVLTNDALMRMAPSIFATEPWHKMSDRYTFIPTIQIVDKMRSEGFQPFSAVQSRTRVPGKADFTRHMIRFRDVRQGAQPATLALGQLYPELVLTNAHDGASRYKLNAGLWRAICLNGLMVSDTTLGEVSVKHSGSVDGIIDASYSVVEQFPKVLDSVEQFSQLRLTSGQQEAFGRAALTLRYDEGAAPVEAAQVIRPRRSEDVDPTLWNVYNRAQETLTQGGLRGRNASGNRTTTRAVNGIAENTKLNKALWQLTEEMRKLMS